eukprot:TCONS_00043269-protein
MDQRAAYQDFLVYFHQKYGYIRPPSFEEWVYNHSYPQLIGSHRHQAPNQTFFQQLNTQGQQMNSQKRQERQQEPHQGERCTWTAGESDMLVSIWRNNYGKILNDAFYNNIAQSISQSGPKIKTAQQCRTKIKNLKKAYNKAKEHNNH